MSEIKIVELDIKALIDSGLTPTQLFVLVSILNEHIEILKTITIPVEELKQLESDSWIKYWGGQEFSSMVLRQKSIKLLQKTKVFINFDEFYEAYPKSVPGRPLRSIKKDSKVYKDAKAKYFRAVRTEEQHESVKKALKRELASRELNGTMKFMQNILAYINQRTWEKWEEDEVTTVEISSYGEEDL